MKRLTIFLILLGCIALSSHAHVRLYPPYDRNFNPRSSEFTPNTLVPADSTLTTVFDGIEMSAMDYASIYITHDTIDNYHCALHYIVGYGPSPRLRKLNKNSTERQKLIIADNPFYIADLQRPTPGTTPDYTPFTFMSTEVRATIPTQNMRLYDTPQCLANNLTFDFDLSEYACEFDIYILSLGSLFIFDNAFSNFKFSDNIKSVNIYLSGVVYEIGHNAFVNLRNVEKVDMRLCSHWFLLDFYGQYYKVTDDTSDLIIYSDSFSQETYDTATLVTFSSESEINETLTNPTANNYHNNVFRFFKNCQSGVEDVAVDYTSARYTIQGRTIELTNLIPHQVVNVYTFLGANVGCFMADGLGMLHIDIAQSGFYILKAGNICLKVAIH